MQVNLHGRTQRQREDDRWYTCIAYIRVVGTPVYDFVPRCTLRPPASLPAPTWPDRRGWLSRLLGKPAATAPDNTIEKNEHAAFQSQGAQQPLDRMPEPAGVVVGIYLNFSSHQVDTCANV